MCLFCVRETEHLLSVDVSLCELTDKTLNTELTMA